MIHKVSVTKALMYLYAIVSEPLINLKRYSLQSAYKKSNHDKILDIVLSNYFDKTIHNSFTPRFNTIQYVDFKQDMLSLTIATEKRKTFYSLPFISQQLLFLMSDVSKIGLTLQDLTKVKFKYIAVKEMLSYGKELQ